LCKDCHVIARRWTNTQPTLKIQTTNLKRIAHDEEMLAAQGYDPVGFERPDDAIAACSAPDRFDVILVSHASQISAGLDLAHARFSTEVAFRAGALAAPLRCVTAVTRFPEIETLL
jgi:hypothetical protein